MVHVQFILIITFTLTESLKLTPNCILQTVNILFPHEEGKTCQSFVPVSSHGTTFCLSFCFLCRELFYEMLCEYLSSLPGFGANQRHHSKNLLQFTSPGASFRTVKLWGYRKMSAGEKRSSNLVVKI